MGLLVHDPLLQVLRRLRALAPLVADFVEAFALAWEGEVREVRAQDDRRQVLHERRLEGQLLLLWCQHLVWLRFLRLLRLLLLFLLYLLLLLFLLLFLLHFLVFCFLLLLLLLFFAFGLFLRGLSGFLFCLLDLLLCLVSLLFGKLDRLLSGLLGLLFLLRHLLQPGLLHLSGFPSLLGLLLLLFEDRLMNLGLVCCRRLPDADVSDFLEHRVLPVRKQPFPLVLHQIALDLHDHVVPGLHGGDRQDGASDAVVVHLLDAEALLRLVFVGHRVGAVALLPPDLALLGPVQDHAVADLRELRVLLQELVEPVETALSRQADRKDDLVLAAGRGVGLRDNDVTRGGILQHPALEGKRSERLGAKVDVGCDVLVGNGGEQSLALQGLRQGLRLR
mmetsp:Transcript_18394/g.53164  ORF Transcript_18394/g.53164 Transcript_18394/m.53164 type:complete len:391 (+) Transcript_18394:1112-2284(+)